ncbi:MAG TPA: efflux transporter outer membrane subunit [Tepidisphaeraceae bacterium]|nr:efflux transporter outer membrane subunit [Tepidisphaeraceae bacterium]
MAGLAAGLLFSLIGCEVGPDYHRPAMERPARFKSQDATRPAANAAITPQWWTLFHDPALDHLVAIANTYNQDLRAAIARVDEARALARIAGSYLFPTVTLDPTFTRAQTSGNRVSPITGQKTPAFTYNDWLVPFDLRYEVDIWGRVRRQLETVAAQARATAFDQSVIRLTVDTDVAVYYFTLRSLDAQRQILGQNVAAYREQVRIVTAQLKNGLISTIDVSQAQAQLNATLAQWRDIERARADEEHALATLCGRPAPLFSVAADPLLFTAPPQAPPGLPAQLLNRRADVAEAEQNLIAANAQIGVATADFYPVFTLTGSAGFESASVQNIFDWRSKIASIGPSFSAPIFEGGRLANNLEYTKARFREALAAYVKQLLIAYGDVENALTDLHALTDEARMLTAAVDSSKNYLRIARVQYFRGLVSYLTVIDAERTLLANQLSLSQTMNQQMSASVHLIQALGGGWTPQ